MKKQLLALFASAVMLSTAVALFAYNFSTPATAKIGAANAAITPIPTALDHAIIKVVPVDNPTAVGEEITVADLSAIIATKNPALPGALANKFKLLGWEWTAQTKVKVTAGWYRVLPGETARVAPPSWDWRQVVAVTDSLCGDCIDSGRELPAGGDCCRCCYVE